MKQPPPSRGRSRLLRWLVTFAVVVSLALRKSDVFFNPQLWAEDGGLFFIGAETSGWRVLFAPYEGYLHVIPRLLASLGAYLPLTTVPVFYAGSALLVTGIVAWRLQSPRIRLPGGTIAALAIALIPHNGEVYLTISNLQWITGIALFALAVTDDAVTGPEHIGDLLLLVLAGLSGPFVLLSLPMFAWRVWKNRSRTSAGMLVIAMGCAAAHLPSLLHRAPQIIAQPIAPWHFAAIVGRRVVATLFIGRTHIGEWACRAITVVGAALLLVTIWRRRGRLPDAGPLFFALAAVLIATAYKARIDTWALDELFNGDRYFFISKVLLLWLLSAVALTGSFPLRAGVAVALVSLVIANSPRFFFPPAPDQHWREYSLKIQSGQPTDVSILPEGFGFTHPGRHR